MKKKIHLFLKGYSFIKNRFLKLVYMYVAVGKITYQVQINLGMLISFAAAIFVLWYFYSCF